jgi:hypothetical protein
MTSGCHAIGHVPGYPALATATPVDDHGKAFSNLTSSNIEPLAREMAERICRRSGMADADVPRWVDLHWPCAAAMLEAGVMDERGEWVEDKDVRLGLEAYRERLKGRQ